MIKRWLINLSNILRHPINRGRPFSALWRYFRWQFASRVKKTIIKQPWVLGAHMLVQSGDHGFTGNIYSGLQDYSEMLFLLHFLREGEAFVDVGANLGTYSVLAAKGRNAQVVSIEPVPQTFKRLEQNVTSNQLGKRISTKNLAVGDREGEVLMTSLNDCENHIVDGGDTDTAELIAVQSTTLDTLLVGLAPNLIKIDVEGFELPVLLGAKSTFDQSRLFALIIEINGAGEKFGRSDEDIIEALNRYGLSAVHYDPKTRTLESREIVRPCNGNYIFVTSVEEAQQKIISAPTISLYGRDY